MDTIVTYFNSFLALDWMGIFRVVRIVFVILNILLIGIFVFAWRQAWKYRPQFQYPKKKKIDVSQGSLVNIKDDWEKILEKMKSDAPQVLTIAIIDADKLVDDVLQMLGFPGEHVADRLDKLGRTQKLKTLDSLWQAHRIRNNLVHATGFQISPRQAREVITTYEKFFKEIKVL